MGNPRCEICSSDLTMKEQVAPLVYHWDDGLCSECRDNMKKRHKDYLEESLIEKKEATSNE